MNDWFRLSRWRRVRPIGLVALIVLGALGLSLFWVTGQVGAQSTAPSGAQPAATRTPFSNPTATPPTQGGNGANTFYVYCMPCHGDRGQGLTDEFRNRQYPPEDVNCWKSGCHGPRPYENGFTLPITIPMLIGPGALAKFQTAQDLYGFIRKAMPFNSPGSLTDTQYVNLTAFLLEGNQIVLAGVQLNTGALATIKLRVGTSTPDVPTGDDNAGLWIGLVVFVGVATLLSILTRPHRHRDRETGSRD